MILSNKGILAILWELFPDHPNLLPAYFDDALLEAYARKPLLSREGANVSLVLFGQTVAETRGDYGDEGFVYQALAPLPIFDGSSAVIGSWVVAGEPAGVGIRESDGPITGNTSRFVPHRIR
jgi:glutathionylspermidine synthase